MLYTLQLTGSVAIPTFNTEVEFPSDAMVTDYVKRFLPYAGSRFAVDIFRGTVSAGNSAFVCRVVLDAPVARLA